MVNETIDAVVGGGFNAGLDKFLNIAVPIAIFGVFGFMIYNAFREHFDRLFAWIGSKWRSAMNPDDEKHTAKYAGIQIDSRAEIYK